MPNDWWSYVERVGGGVVQTELAARSGIEQTAFSRWKQGRNHPSPEKAIQFARGLGRPPTEALVAAGYITEAEAAEAIEVHRGPDTLSDDELLAEVRRRMSLSPADLPGTPLDRLEQSHGK